MDDEQEQQQKQKDKRWKIDKDESERHYKEKVRLSIILQNAGFHTSIEKRLPCFVELGSFRCRYRADVYAEGGQGNRKIICEIDGYKGHKTKQARDNQLLRLRRIRETYGNDIQEYRFNLRRLARWTDTEIAQEMKL